MGVSTLGDWVGKWKQLKNWVLQRSDTVPSDIVEGGFYYDNIGKKPMYYDGTQAKPIGVTNHNELDEIDGGDATYKGHTTNVQAGYLDNAGIANGVALLDSNGYLPIDKVPASLLGAVRFQGTWNASSNSPTLATTPTADTKGHYYVVSTAGTWKSMTFAVGDWVISNGSAWQRVDNVDAISSVFGRTGAVVATSGDYDAAQVTNTPAGNISATTVQAALNELDSEKLDTATALSTYATKETTGKLRLGTCSTAQGIVAKVVTLSNYALTQGDIIEVLFTNASVASATLNVNGTGAKAIYDGGSATAINSWGAGQLVGLMYDGAYWHILWVKTPSSTGNISDRTLSANVKISENSANHGNFPLTFNDGGVSLYKTASKLYFNPSKGLLQATKVGVIGGTSAGFLKADGTVDTNTYATLSSVPVVDSVPTDGSMNAVSSNGVFDAIASLQPKHSTGANSDGGNAGWLSDISVKIPKTTEYADRQSIFNVKSYGGTSSSYQWTARVILSIKIQDYSPSYKLTILDGDNYKGFVYGRYDQDTNYHYFTPEFYIPPWGYTEVELESGHLPESFTATYIPSMWSYSVAATVYDNYLESNTGTHGGVELKDDGSADKGGYRGLSVGGAKRLVLLSRLDVGYCGLYNETDRKWLLLLYPDGALRTDCTPPIGSDDNQITTTAWVKDVCPQLGSGFSAGTYHWFGALASRGSDSKALYFCY